MLIALRDALGEYETSSGRRVTRGEVSPAALALDATGARLVVACAGAERAVLACVDVASGRVVAAVPLRTSAAPTCEPARDDDDDAYYEPVRCEFSADDRWLLVQGVEADSGNLYAATANVFDTRDWTPVFTAGAHDYDVVRGPIVGAAAVAFSPGGSRIALAESSGAVHLVEPSRRRMVRVAQAGLPAARAARGTGRAGDDDEEERWPIAVAVARSLRRAAVVYPAELCVYARGEGWRLAHRLALPGPAWFEPCLAHFAGDERVYIARPRGLDCVDLRAGRGAVLRFDELTLDLGWRERPLRLVSAWKTRSGALGSVRVLRAATGRARVIQRGARLRARAGPAHAVAVSADETTIARAEPGQCVRVTRVRPRHEPNASS